MRLPKTTPINTQPSVPAERSSHIGADGAAPDCEEYPGGSGGGAGELEERSSGNGRCICRYSSTARVPPGSRTFPSRPAPFSRKDSPNPGRNLALPAVKSSAADSPVMRGLFGMVFFGGVMGMGVSLLNGALTLALMVLRSRKTEKYAAP